MALSVMTRSAWSLMPSIHEDRDRVRVKDRVSHTVGELLLLPPQHVGRQEGRLGCVECLPQQPPC
eukprot:scaffold113222_cov45-Phaeocystis_antarctica.AAC.2